MYACRNFALTALTLALVGLSVPAQAGSVVLSNLNQPAMVSSSNPYVGQSFIAGNVNQTLFGAEMQMNTASPPSTGIELEVEARSSTGTVGQTLFDKFSSSYDSTTGLITFTALSPFQLTAGTGYFLVLSDAHNGGVSWDFTPMYVYQSEFGYGLPSFNTSWISNEDNGAGNSTYYNPSTGAQMFSLVTTGTVPEPSSIILGAIAVLGMVVFVRWFRAQVHPSPKPHDPLAIGSYPAVVNGGGEPNETQRRNCDWS